MRRSTSRRAHGLLLALAIGVASCSQALPTPTAIPTPTATPSPAPSPSPTAVPPVQFPLAVVTGITNLKAWVTSAELASAAEAGTLVIPCAVTVIAPAVIAAAPPSPCIPADEIAALLVATPVTLALLPPALVDPRTKSLPVDPSGPYSQGGADLFGNAAARARPYPIQGEATTLPADWTGYDSSAIWTLMSLGDSCPARGVSYQAITLQRGWNWVMGGGTAEYDRVYPNPVPLEAIGGGYNIVAAHVTGNEGAVGRLTSAADVTIDDFECPVIANFDVIGEMVFSIDPAVLPVMRSVLGVDVAYIAANHMTDHGPDGLRQTREYFASSGIQTVGGGMNLAEALVPAIVEVHGIKIGFVAFNDVPGVMNADPISPGVPWITEANVAEGIRLAKAAGAQVVFCDPQWWGGSEYHGDLQNAQVAQQEMFYALGCDHIVGAGTHNTGPFQLRKDARGVHVTMASAGNFLFGQDWSQETQEGVIMELAFRGTEVVQARFHPYIVLFQAQADLINPETDGHYLMERLWQASESSY